MSAEFTSGVFYKEEAWHGEGVVTDELLTPQQAFETAEALFKVEKHELYFKDSLGQEHESGAMSLVRQDTGTELGICTDQYEIVQNELLLQMANSLREDIDMESVVVLADGGKVAFTGLIRGTTKEVLPGDRINKRIVGYLGHDGKTGIGALFTDIRVVCSNTLALASATSKMAKRITHKGGANVSTQKLIESIDMARQNFESEVDVYRAMADVKLTQELWVEYLERLFHQELKGTIQKDKALPPRPKTLEDIRAVRHMTQALHTGFGHDINGVFGSLWGGFNGITEVLTSEKRGDTSPKKQNSLYFGSTKSKVLLAKEIAMDMAGV